MAEKREGYHLLLTRGTVEDYATTGIAMLHVYYG